MASVNTTVNEIHSLIPQTHIPNTNQFICSSRSRSKRGIFDFVGQISKSLFGTATSDDIDTLQRHMQTLNRNNIKITQAMAVLEKHLSSFISTVDARFNNVMNAITRNHNDIVALTDLLHQSVDSVEHEFALLEQLILKQTNASTHLNLTLQHIKISIHELLKGKLSPFLITPHVIKSSVHQIQNIIDEKYPQFNIIHNDPLYYLSFGDFLYARLHSILFLTLKIPISPFKQPLLLYRVYSFPVPINSSTSHATQLTGTPTYFAHTHDNQHFTSDTTNQLSNCIGTSTKILSVPYGIDISCFTFMYFSVILQ